MTQSRESSSSSRMKSIGKCVGGNPSHPLDGKTQALPPSQPEEESPSISELTMSPVEYAALRELETLLESLHTLMSLRCFQATHTKASYSPFLNEGTLELRFYLTKMLRGPNKSPLSQKPGLSSTVQINSSATPPILVVPATRTSKD